MRKPSRPLVPGYRVNRDTIERPATGCWPPAYRIGPEHFDDLRAIERLDQDLGRLAIDDATRRRLLRDALARNAYGTASIEGNPLTLEEVESLLARGLTPNQVREPEEREILRHAELLQQIDELAPPRSVADVNRLHLLYFDGILERSGRLKTRPNFIGTRPARVVVYLPTAPRATPHELQALLHWTHGAPEHPLVKASLFFHEFQSIHPYPDGNGRLGRLLTTQLLYHWGYRGVRYALLDYAANQDRDAYYAALNEGRRHEWDRTPWLTYHLRLIRTAYETTSHRLLLLDRLPATLNERQFRVAEWFARLTREHPRLEVKFNDVHAAFPVLPRRTLTYDLGVLVGAGVLARTGERKATRYRFGLSKPRT